MAAETSVDAKVPVALALLKLSFKFSLKYFQEVSWLQNNNVYKAVFWLTKFSLTVLQLNRENNSRTIKFFTRHK